MCVCVCVCVCVFVIFFIKHETFFIEPEKLSEFLQFSAFWYSNTVLSCIQRLY